MTANENWDEVKSGLLSNQKAKDRPDLVNRVFWMKLKSMINDIDQGEIFGEVISLLWVVEFQKLGKPHAHLLVTLGKNSKLKTGADIDQCISAERPINNPELLSLVEKFMIHSNNVFIELQN